MGGSGTAVGEAAESPGSSKRRREKSKLRRHGKEKGKSSDNKSMKIKKKRMKKQKKLKMKMKLKMKKRSSTNSHPDPDPDPQQQEREQTNQTSESQSSEPRWPQFSDGFFNDYRFTYRTYGTERFVGRRGRRIPCILSHIAAEDEAQNSERCQFFTKFAVDEFNKSNNANLELVLIESMNETVNRGFVYFLRFVAKDLNTGYTGLYRAAVHLFKTTMTLVHFKDEELEWRD